MEKDTNIEKENSVTTNEDNEQESAEQLKARVAELEEVAKNKAIEARLAKKENKETPEVDSSILERVANMELKDLGLKNEEEITLIKKEAGELGIDPVKLVKRGLAASILESHRKEKAAQEAIPEGNSRGNASQRDSVDYWIAKGELPPSDNVELRQKVVRKKRENAKKSQMFNYEI